MVKRSTTYRLRLPLAIAAAAVASVLLGLVRPGAVSSRTAKEAFWTHKVFDTQQHNILFSGDSRLYRGIDPLTVQAQLAPLQVTAFNFGLSAGGHNPAMFAQLDSRLVERGPRAVVLGLSPFSLTPKGQENGHLEDLLRTTRTDQFVNLHLAPRLQFFDPIQPEEFQQWMHRDSIGYYEQFRPGGWVASQRLPLRPDEALGSYRRQFKDNEVSQAVLDTVLMQVRAWTARGVKVFAFRPPTTREMVSLEDSLSGYPALEVSRQWESAGGIWIDVGPETDYVSYDGSHLDWRSATLLSQRVAAAMKPHLKILP